VLPPRKPGQEFPAFDAGFTAKDAVKELEAMAAKETGPELAERFYKKFPKRRTTMQSKSSNRKKAGKGK
jgi:hypothetical protein